MKITKKKFSPIVSIRKAMPKMSTRSMNWDPLSVADMNFLVSSD